MKILQCESSLANKNVCCYYFYVLFLYLFSIAVITVFVHFLQAFLFITVCFEPSHSSGGVSPQSRVHAQGSPCGICGGRSALVQRFPKVPRFLPVNTPLLLRNNSRIIWGMDKGPISRYRFTET
jgi:hypothetical protein